MMRIVRFLCSVIAMCATQAALSQTTPSIASESWPTRPVKIVIGLPPGSGSDQLARALAQELSETWKQPVVVENKPGANGIIAASTVAKSPADGTTLFLAIDANITTNPHVYRSLPYDPIKDFAPVTMLMTFSTLLVAHPSVPVSTIEELIAKAKTAPGTFTYASIGEGSNMHLLSETFEQSANIKLMHVPYRGIPQMTTALITGEVQLGWLGAFTAKPLVAEGRLKALGISGGKRTHLMQHVPTFGEAKFPDVDITVWYGLLAPAATPAPIVERIHQSVSRIISQPAFREKHLIPKGYEPSGIGTAAFAEHIRQELVSRGKMVKQAGVKPQDN
jgi:tripartite-type tricarboxylate transporter receptor subunit TctC